MRLSAASSFMLLIAIRSFFLQIAHAGQVTWLVAVQGTASCIPKERDALLDFKNSIKDTNNLLLSWQHGQDCCRWVGITCRHQTGNVLRLDLSSATLPDESLEGQEISPSLLSLQHLEYLDLSGIRAVGPNSSSPEFLGSMRSLRHLDLTGLLVSGGIPPQLANLSKLEYLDLTAASFSRRVPPGLGNLSNLQHLGLGSMPDMYSNDVSWLTHLRLLEYLDMGNINLSMAVDWPHVLNSFPSLKVLYLTNCNLLVQTKHSDLMDKLPRANIGDIQQQWTGNFSGFGLFSLDLANNHLTGAIPPGIANIIPNIVFLDLSGNNLTGIIPRTVRNCSSLHILILRSNQLSGQIPSLPLNFTRLDLSLNFLSGPLPLDIGSPDLDVLILASNYITGQIPQSICKAQYMGALDLSNNFMEGTFPQCLQMGSLRFLLLI